MVILVILAIYGNADAQRRQWPQRPTRPQKSIATKIVTIKNDLLTQTVSGTTILTDCTNPSITVSSKKYCMKF